MMYLGSYKIPKRHEPPTRADDWNIAMQAIGPILELLKNEYGNNFAKENIDAATVRVEKQQIAEEYPGRSERRGIFAKYRRRGLSVLRSMLAERLKEEQAKKNPAG